MTYDVYIRSCETPGNGMVGSSNGLSSVNESTGDGVELRGWITEGGIRLGTIVVVDIEVISVLEGFDKVLATEGEREQATAGSGSYNASDSKKERINSIP